MSRPPRPLRTALPGSGRAPWPRDYLPYEHADFLALQRRLAQTELGLVSSGEEGDFAGTLMDLSALLAHLLGVYQNRYAREAFLGTAQSARSLVWHGRRLGYEPAPGLAATGFAALTVHPGLSGLVAQGFVLSSSPVGEQKAQTYETLEPVKVDARHNVLTLVRLEDGGAAVLEGELPLLEPGAYVLLHTADDAEQLVFEVVRLTFVQPLEEPPGPRVRVGWRVLEHHGPVLAWSGENLHLRGNLVPLSHGRTVEQVLGDSDGQQPFLRFALDTPRVTHLPAPGGAEPVVEVSVGGVRWVRVQDFSRSDADDPHYVVQRDEAEVTYVLFGDGRRGAIPPSGQRHILATYRVGLGREGNADAGRVNRIPRAHPLLMRATNPVPVYGGTEPADVRGVRTQATRRIRTFDRAVSVRDHADLALLFAGVERASARWTEVAPGHEGVELVVSTLEGELPPSSVLEALRLFLDTRRDTSVALRLRAPEPLEVAVQLRVGLVSGEPEEAVRQRLREALHGEREEAPGLFTLRARELGEPATLGDVHRVLEQVPGILFTEVERLREAGPLPEGTPEVREVLRPASHQWLRLRPENLTLIVV